MKISVLHFTEDYRGDHIADVCRAVKLKPGETVAELVARLIQPTKKRNCSNLYHDYIELRMVFEEESDDAHSDGF